MSWNEEAPCLGVPGFFPDDDPDIDDLDASEHVRWTYCAWCDLRTICLGEAMKNNEPAGVWGGVPASIRAEWTRTGYWTPGDDPIDLLDRYLAERVSSE